MNSNHDKLIVLALDDDKFIRAVLNDIFDKDFQFYAAGNIKEFNNALKNTTPDIILLDVEMPDICGLTVCSQLRQKGYDSFIIIMSANDDEKTIIQAYQKGADDYIRKPFLPFEMKEKINLISKNILYSAKLENLLKNQKKFGESLFKLSSIISSNIVINSKESLLESVFQVTGFIKVSYTSVYLIESSQIHEMYFDDSFTPVEIDVLKSKIDFFSDDHKTKQTVKLHTSSENQIYCHIRKIFLNNKLSGYLILQSRTEFSKHSFEMLSLYMNFINLKGSSIEKENILKNEIRKERRELGKVRSIQVSLLPDFEEVNNFDVASTFIPMEEISGDFFDGYFIDKNTYQITLCDVSGHGIASSYVGSSIRGILRSAANETESISELVSYLNNQIFTGFKNIYYFSTLVVCRMNLVSGEIEIVSAGHPPCYYFNSKKNSIFEITNTGPLIGLMQNAKYDTHSIKMDKDDILLFYTDGISEATAQNSDEMFGHRKLRKSFTENSKSSAIEMVHSILGEVYEHTEYNSFEDDVTILCIKRTI